MHAGIAFRFRPHVLKTRRCSSFRAGGLDRPSRFGAGDCRVCLRCGIAARSDRDRTGLRFAGSGITGLQRRRAHALLSRFDRLTQRGLFASVEFFLAAFGFPEIRQRFFVLLIFDVVVAVTQQCPCASASQHRGFGSAELRAFRLSLVRRQRGSGRHRSALVPGLRRNARVRDCRVLRTGVAIGLCVDSGRRGREARCGHHDRPSPCTVTQATPPCRSARLSRERIPIPLVSTDCRHFATLLREVHIDVSRTKRTGSIRLRGSSLTSYRQNFYPPQDVRIPFLTFDLAPSVTSKPFEPLGNWPRKPERSVDACDSHRSLSGICRESENPARSVSGKITGSGDLPNDD